jgi:hypothetical protein
VVPGAGSTNFDEMRAAGSGSISEGAIAGSCALVLDMLWCRKSRPEAYEGADASRRLGSLAVRLQFCTRRQGLHFLNSTNYNAPQFLANPCNF